MGDYNEVRETVDVPRGTGVQGFLKAIEEILKLPRVQEVKIDARGKVSYFRYLRDGETNVPLEVDFDTLQPYAVLRNARSIVEISGASVPNDASRALAIMFRACSKDQLMPIAFIGGANTVLFEWFRKSTGLFLDQEGETVYGVPFHKDRQVDDASLFLAAAYTRNSALIDVQKAYKILMPAREEPVKPPTSIKVKR
jgi:hypothetical protein